MAHQELVTEFPAECAVALGRSIVDGTFLDDPRESCTHGMNLLSFGLHATLPASAVGAVGAVGLSSEDRQVATKLRADIVASHYATHSVADGNYRGPLVDWFLENLLPRLLAWLDSWLGVDPTYPT